MKVDEILSQVSKDQLEKARACSSVEELVELAKTEGVELTDEMLEAMSGGQSWYEECDHGYSGY